MESKQRKTRTCLRCKTSEILELSEMWHRLFTIEREDWIKGYITMFDEYPPECLVHAWHEEE